jgi:transcriptional regulator with XRE-family HTH domain
METTPGAISMSSGESFGSIFRSKRESMGLSIREFCRRNKFDAAKISRLERGIDSPPHDLEILESYAKALKINKNRSEWFDLLDSAAIETGQIPADLLKDSNKIRALMNQIQRIRYRGLGHRNWVKAQDLDKWSDKQVTRSILPDLVRRLVRATGKGLQQVEFPSYEQNHRPGWDGIVIANENDEHVPLGTSVWELSVDKDPKKKANADFAKRTKQTLGLDPSQTVFIYVTTRNWQKKDEWVSEKKLLAIWKDVRVYDSATLEEWLMRSPGVDVWTANLIGTRTEGLSSIENYWDILQESTRPSLKPGVFLESRDEQIKNLENRLTEKPDSIEIVARSEDEIIDFFAAFCIDQERSNGRFLSNTLIVDDKSAWGHIIEARDAELILIPRAFEISIENKIEANRNGHWVIVPKVGEQEPQKNAIILQRPYYNDTERALIACGLSQSEARSKALQARGCTTVLKRLLAKEQYRKRPQWSEGNEARDIVPLMLTGSWDSKSEGDKSALEKLAEKPYSSVAGIAERWRDVPDAPLVNNNDLWTLFSREDSWELIRPYIKNEHIARFSQTALEILGCDRKSTYSFHLRKGIAQSLALLGARKDYDVGFIVTKLLDRQTESRWISLANQTPLLAEAAPDAFLQAVEHDLARPDSVIINRSKNAQNQNNRLLDLDTILAAVELLAWDRNYLTRVTRILAKIENSIPTSERSYGPLYILLQIFMPWYPQTKANAQERLKILEKLFDYSPKTAWRLILQLIPHPLQLCISIRQPLYRDWILDWKPGVSNEEYWIQLEAMGNLLVKHMGMDVERIVQIVSHYESFQDSVRSKFLQSLEQIDLSQWDDLAKGRIHDSIQDKMLSIRDRFDVNLSHITKLIDELDELKRRFTPENPIFKHIRLFRPSWLVVQEFERDDRKLNAARHEAIEEIYRRFGVDGILQLVDAAESAEDVGFAFGQFIRANNQEIDIRSLLASKDPKKIGFVNNVIWAIIRDQGHDDWDWVDRLITDEWTDEEIARFLAVLPFTKTTWDYAAKKGDAVSDLYWQSTDARGSEHLGETAAYVVDKLIKSNRSYLALNTLWIELQNQTHFSTNILMDVLDSWRLEYPDDGHIVSSNPFDFMILGIFDELHERYLQNSADLDRDRLENLEWRFLRLLDGFKLDPKKNPIYPRLLFDKLKSTPEFFVDVLSLAHPGKADHQHSLNAGSNIEASIAKNPSLLLSMWNMIPGIQADGSIDEDLLLTWIKEARRLASSLELLEICDFNIGRVLAHSPAETDGTWPCIPVRDAIETIGTVTVTGSFANGIYNNRGLYYGSGGSEENELASKYREFAKAYAIEWPKTSEALLAVVELYAREAKAKKARTESDHFHN